TAMAADPQFPETVALYMYDISTADYRATVDLAQQTELRIAGHDDIFIAGLKSFADGGLPIYTGLISRPYEEVFPPYTSAVFPTPYMGLADVTTNAMTRRALMSHAAGYPLMIHELGDRAGR